jgi:hypothetical protein
MPLSDTNQQELEVQGPMAPADQDRRHRLLGALTDLFVGQTHHSAEEVRQFEAAVEGLLPHTTPDVQLQAAEALADHPYTPLGAVKAFLALGGDLGAPFLRRSVCVPRVLVSDFAQNGDAAEACCIANRVDLDATQVALLCERQEIEVLRALGRNAMAPLDQSNFGNLVRQARFDRQLARSLCMRARDPMAIAPIFLFANTTQREAIILATRRAGLGEALAEPLSDVELTIGDELIEAAETRNLDEASWLVARAVGCTSTLARDIIADASGEPLALVLAMLRIDVEAANRILLMFDAPPMRSLERMKTLSNIIQDMPRGCAERLLKKMVGLNHQRFQPTHMPVYDPTAAQTPSRPADMGALIAAVESSAPERKNFLLRR